jgi:glutamyl-tRNA reductase
LREFDTMSGSKLTQALADRFEAIRQAELGRLEKKLRGLTEHDRRSVEALTADIIHGIASVPERALGDGHPQHALDALARLFALEGEGQMGV